MSKVFASDASLMNTNLTGANFREAKLYSADMDGAVLVGTNFREAKLYGADLSRLGNN